MNVNKVTEVFKETILLYSRIAEEAGKGEFKFNYAFYQLAKVIERTISGIVKSMEKTMQEKLESMGEKMEVEFSDIRIIGEKKYDRKFTDSEELMKKLKDKLSSKDLKKCFKKEIKVSWRELKPFVKNPEIEAIINEHMTEKISVKIKEVKKEELIHVI